MKPNKHDDWARRKVRALLTHCFHALALAAQSRGEIALAQRFIALAAGLDEDER